MTRFYTEPEYEYTPIEEIRNDDPNLPYWMQKVPPDTEPTEDDILSVKRGAEYLDEKYGYYEWRRAIDLEELALWNGNSCVLGQVGRNILDMEIDNPDLYNPYCQMLDALGLSSDMAKSLGFYRQTGPEYDGLQVAWGRFLEETT